MTDNKPLDRRSSELKREQDSEDLNSAITELHQTIVRLNKVIDRVHPKTREIASRSFGKGTAQAAELTLAALKIPDVVH